jgi:8-oxo-dGTP pyrophosphatase MutT (NUDIX family)
MFPVLLPGKGKTVKTDRRDPSGWFHLPDPASDSGPKELRRPHREGDSKARPYARVVANDEIGEPTRWRIHEERIVDDTRRARLSIASVELPDGVTFEQYVLRLPRAAMTVVLDDADRVLMMWRHRFIFDRWVWELPGGYVDETEDPAVSAAREVEEETGWRPGKLELLLSFQPMVGTADAENLLYLARGAEYVGTPADINEAKHVDWIGLNTVHERIARGEIVGAASIVGLLAVLERRCGDRAGSTDQA